MKMNFYYSTLLAFCVFASPLIIKGGVPGKDERQSRTELTEQRSRTSKTFLLEGNKRSGVFASGSIHFKDEMNVWAEIDNTIIQNTDVSSAAYPFKNETNAVKTYFPGNPFSDHLLMITKEGAFKERIIAIEFVDAAGNVLGTVPANGAVVAKVAGNKISYEGFANDLSLNYLLGNDGRKFQLDILSKSFLKLIPQNTKSVRIREEFMALSGKAEVRSGETGVEFLLNGEIIFGFEQPKAFDDNDAVENFSDGMLELAPTAQGCELLSVFPVNWLFQSENQFPVHLDPIVNYYPQNVSMWTGRFESSATKTNGYLRLTAATTASWAKFDMATLPPGAAVVQATYWGYHYSTTSTSDKIADIRSLQSIDPVTATAAVLWPQCTTGPVYNNNYIFGGTTYTWRPGPLGGTALTDVANSAGNWFGLGFSYNSGSTTFKYHYGTNGTAAQVCYLEVEYFTTPCGGTPPGNTITQLGYSICPNGTVALAFDSTYTFGGLSYQWYSSTLSNVGPFNPVSNATLNTLNTPPIPVSTWFTAVVTCSNGGGTFTMSSQGVMVQGTTTNTAPYHEGFEGVPRLNDYPNCSWLADDIGGSNLTYTAAMGNDRYAATGSKYASFENSPPGQSHFYTNGIWLNAGVTYSASLWYLTGTGGGINWSDLSILVGTAQNSSALVPIVSTNGPAVSANYKSLSNTFTVNSSGLYYIAVRAEGNAGTSPFLSFDDLRIDIPCQLNTPAIQLTANSQTICSGEPVSLSATGATSYQWNTGQNTASIIDNPFSNTTYVVTGTDPLSGCSAQASLNVVVRPAPNVAAFSDKVSVCEGKPVVLSASGALTYNWSIQASGNSVTHIPTGNTSYTVFGAGANGCTGSAVVDVTVNPNPSVIVSADRNVICVGEPINLTAQGALSYVWTTPNSVLLQGVTVSDMPQMSGSYSVTGTDLNGCEANALLSFSVEECLSVFEQRPGSSLKVFPVPATSEIIVEGVTVNTLITITDVTGRVLIEQTVEGKQIINIESLSAGTYFLKDGHRSVRLIKN